MSRLAAGLRLAGGGLALFTVAMLIGPARFYPPAFRSVGNVFLSDFGGHRVAKFEPASDPRGVADTTIAIGSDANGFPAYASRLGINSVREAYVPTVALIALLFATPMPWPRRWKTLAIGLAVVHAFIALRIIVACLFGFSRIGLGEDHLLEVGRVGMWALARADQIASADLHLTYVIPILTWMVLAAPSLAVSLVAPRPEPAMADERDRPRSTGEARIP